ncbi:MAG: hypothetical protein ACQESP_08335 [Candidatus Muiribacteriota bacterium]
MNSILKAALGSNRAEDFFAKLKNSPKKTKNSMDKLFNSLSGAGDKFNMSPQAKKSIFHYQSINLMQEQTFAQFKDEEGNEFSFMQERFKVTFQEIWHKTSELPPAETEKDIEKFDKMLGNYSSDKVSDRLLDFSKAVYGLFSNPESKYYNSEMADKSNYISWAKNNITNGFNQAKSIFSNFIKDDNPYNDIFKLTYDKTMNKIDDFFGVNSSGSDENNQSETVEEYHEHYFELEVESTYIGVNLVDE